MSSIEAFFLNVNKPANVTSRKIVDLVGKATRTRQCGHAGTLDPLATGVLVIGVGKATKLVEYVQRQPKTYVAEFTLGQSSDTDDCEGEIAVHEVASPPQQTEIEAQLRNFVGDILQVPPAYSAIKRNGKRAYDLARQGKTVTLDPRPVHIEEITLLEYSFPLIKLEITCGSGTYIRSIARDLGENLGTGGLMSKLTRTAIGPFTLANAVSTGALEDGDWHEACLRPEQVSGLLPHVELSEALCQDFHHGKPFRCTSGTPEGEFFALDPQGKLLGVARNDRGVVCVVKGGFA